ncbi:MAG: hypothetical protein U0441_20215 [Polyangiaceae bacterium]
MLVRTALRPSAAVVVLALATCAAQMACSAGPKPGGNAGDGGSGAFNAGGSTGGDNGTIGSGGQTGTIDTTCGSSKIANKASASILVVLDKSGSMSGGSGVPEKWTPTVAAIKTMMDASSPDLGMGLLPFPEGKFDDSGLAGCVNPSTPACQALYADGGCEDVAMTPVVLMGPLSQTKVPIASWMDGSGPGGNTPTLTALKRAYGYMQSIDVPGQRFVLLLTDGEPTTHEPAQDLGFGIVIPESNVKCGELTDIEAEALNAANAAVAVKTFVIGSPGSEGAADFLSQLAINGGTQKSPNCSSAAGDCHYQIGAANFAQDLQAALAEISGKVSDCVFEIPDGENADPDYVNVSLDAAGMTTQLYKDTSHMDGWDYTDDSHTKVELYGPSCDKFKSTDGAQVDIILGCKTIAK